jgi:hypothetical protein
MPRKLLELFSGTHSVGKVFEGHGWDVTSLDNRSCTNPTICADFMTWDYTQYTRDHFDALWASPDCKTWSIATHIHRNPIKHATEPLKPITDYAKLCNRMIIKLIEVIDYFECPFFVENPRGRLRHFPPMKEAFGEPLLVYYSNYAYPFYKATNIWSNVTLWPNEKKIKIDNYVNFDKGNTIYNERIVIPPLLIERVYEHLTHNT